MKKAIYLTILTALLLPVLVQANDGNDHPHKGPNEAVRKYVKEQILPVLIQKRQQFDRELSQAEKTEIEACRTALKQLRSEHHDWKKPEQNNAASDNKYYGEKTEPNPEFEQRKAIMQRLQVIANNHSNSLQDIKTQLEPARKQWVADIKKLITPPTTDNEKAEANTQHNWHHNHGAEGFLSAHHIASRFLLLPTTATATTDLIGVEEKSDMVEPANTPSPAAIALTNFQIMPNPASNDLQLGNDLLPAVNELKVIDLQGKEIMTLENVQAAQHLDVSTLASGTYLVQIKSGDQTVSKKVVIAK